MIKEQLRQRKTSPRLENFDYRGSYAYSVTCSTEQKKPYFKQEAIVDNILLILKETSIETEFDIYAYCFMPDHLHLLLVGTEDSSLHRFMKLFKQRSSFFFRKAYDNSLWQRSYYDHVIRKEETLNDIILYIFNNPVRKGLVTDYKDYTFSGSFVFEDVESLARPVVADVGTEL
jgi:putative transposase